MPALQEFTDLQLQGSLNDASRIRVFYSRIDTPTEELEALMRQLAQIAERFVAGLQDKKRTDENGRFAYADRRFWRIGEAGIFLDIRTFHDGGIHRSVMDEVYNRIASEFGNPDVEVVTRISTTAAVRRQIEEMASAQGT